MGVLMVLSLGQGEYAEALECYSECVRLCPDVAVAYINRALCHLKLMNVS